MRLVCISDTHNQHGKVDTLGLTPGNRLPPGDVLIHAGDSCGFGTLEELDIYLTWLSLLPFKYKVIISGNHDKPFQRNPRAAQNLLRSKNADKSIIYLQDNYCIIDGIKFYGSPWQPAFGQGWVFNLPRGSLDLKRVWDKIPLDTDVLITHGPPWGYRDQTLGGEDVGCASLRRKVEQIKPKYHIFGHVHEDAGVAKNDHTVFVNASALNRQHVFGNPPIVLDI